MPFNMFKAFSGSRNRAHRGDPAIYNDYPQGYPPGTDFQAESTGMIESQPRLLRRPSTRRREPVFTPLPSRTPTEAEDYNDGYIRVDSPEALMGGALNARPAKIDSVLPALGAPLESPLSESLSEREHREHSERLHDTPRLSDRPPLLQRAGSYHSARGERIGPGNPIAMIHSPSSASDHTAEALGAPPVIYPNERVIPPLPRTHSASYAPGSRSPTDIYNSRPYDVARNIRSHHESEMYHDRYGYEKEGPIYYIIPGGMNVIFQDEYGNEITRVGDFSGRSRPSRPGPFVVQDEHGRELYRYDGYDRRSHRGYSEPQIVLIDSYPSSRRDRSYSSHNYRSDPSYRRGESYDYYPDQREYRDHREKDHRDHRYRGYAEYPSYSEYRDHRSNRDPGAYRDHGSYTRGHGGYRESSAYREHGGHREHGEYRQGRPEMNPPSRVSSRASQRTYTNQMPIPQQHSHAMSDDRRSARDYAASHTSMRHQEDEADISAELQELHV